jgi:hypothetical protein
VRPSYCSPLLLHSARLGDFSVNIRLQSVQVLVLPDETKGG